MFIFENRNEKNAFGLMKISPESLALREFYRKFKIESGGETFEETRVLQTNLIIEILFLRKISLMTHFSISRTVKNLESHFSTQK